MSETSTPTYYRINPTYPEAQDLKGEGKVELFRLQNPGDAPDLLIRFRPGVDQSGGSADQPSASAPDHPSAKAVIEGVTEEVFAQIHNFFTTFDPEIVATRLEVLDQGAPWLTANTFKNQPKDFEQWDHLESPSLPKTLIEACLLSATDDNIPVTEAPSENITRKLFVRDQNYPFHPSWVQSADLQEKKIAILVVNEIIDGTIEPSYFYFNLTDGQPIKAP